MNDMQRGRAIQLIEALYDGTPVEEEGESWGIVSVEVAKDTWIGGIEVVAAAESLKSLPGHRRTAQLTIAAAGEVIFTSVYEWPIRRSGRTL